MNEQFAISKEQIQQVILSMNGCFMTDKVKAEGRKIGYMYREESDFPEDSGWRFFCGDESQAYIEDLSHTGVYAVNTAANCDPDIIPYLDTPAPCFFEKVEGGKYAKLPVQPDTALKPIANNS
jgi:hypothetical protein